MCLCGEKKLITKHITMQNEPIVLERVLHAPVSKVWKALTDARQMQSWYFDIPVFKAEPGFEFIFYGGDEQQQWAHYCKVVEVIKEKKISYTWTYKDQFPEAETTVTFELFDQGDNTTRLRLTHDGVDQLPQDNKNFRRGSFVEGWAFIVGTSLKDYVEKYFIEYTLELPASTARIWDVITNKELIKEWAIAFAPGTYVETDWQPGHVVVWKAGDHGIGAKGVVVANEPEKSLRISYYDDERKEPPAPPDKYTESYKLVQQDGKTTLYITCGPLEEKYASVHGPMWEKAVAKIKALAEREQV
jgi:uncharacterized protein YndB with AHSA1/START domain